MVVSQDLRQRLREHAGKSVRWSLRGADYFTSVWLNGEKLGDHEGCYTPFSLHITSRVKPGQETLLAVKVTCSMAAEGSKRAGIF